MRTRVKGLLVVAIALFASLVVGSVPSPVAAATLVFNSFTSLPSAQGWTYISTGNCCFVPETSAFSVSGGVLHQNTMGSGFGGESSNGYFLANVVDPSKPFTLSMRARVPQEEYGLCNGVSCQTANALGFGFAMFTGTERFIIGIAPDRLDLDAQPNHVQVLMDNTQFHDYRLEGAPGANYKFFVDNVLVATQQQRADTSDPNGLQFGDLTAGANAQADVASYSFTQAPAATQLAFAQQPSSTATVSQPFAVQPQVAVEDANGNAVTTDASTVTLSKGAGSTGSGNLTCTSGLSQAAVNGIASFTGCQFDAAGTYIIHATDGALTPANSNPIVVYAFPIGGAFVVGDGNAAAGSSVTFWSSQWSKDNSLSSGSAPSAFKGFASSMSPTPPACGASSTFVSDPGSSGRPPAGPLPAYMAVLVSSSISKSGSTISGSVVHIVVVGSIRGYAGDSGHAGSGTVVATVC